MRSKQRWAKEHERFRTGRLNRVRCIYGPEEIYNGVLGFWAALDECVPQDASTTLPLPAVQNGKHAQCAAETGSAENRAVAA